MIILLFISRKLLPRVEESSCVWRRSEYISPRPEVHRGNEPPITDVAEQTERKQLPSGGSRGGGGGGGGGGLLTVRMTILNAQRRNDPSNSGRWSDCYKCPSPQDVVKYSDLYTVEIITLGTIIFWYFY